MRVSKLSLVILAMLLVNKCYSTPHENAWFRTTLSIPLRAKLSFDNEWQHRRQNGYGNYNSLNKPLMWAYRSWIHFQANPSLRLSVSPLALFAHYTIIQKPTDELVRPTKETRFTAAAEIGNVIFRQFTLSNRAAVEYRILGKPAMHLIRLRDRIQLKLKMNDRLGIGLSYEYLMNIFGTTVQHYFDHTRSGFSIEYAISPSVRMDLGYLYVVRLPSKSDSKLFENNLLFQMTFRLPSPKK